MQVSGRSLLEAVQSLGLTRYSEEDMPPGACDELIKQPGRLKNNG